MGVIRFYPDNWNDLSIIPAKAFRLRPWRPSSGFPLLLLANDASPHSFHFQVPVKMPVSNLDCVMDSTRGNFRVKYKML
jgi:hypothetical protein